MKKYFIAFSVLFIPLFLYSQSLSYYKNKKDLEGKYAADLKTTLHKLIYPHQEASYGGLKYIYEDSDVKSDGNVWDMYSTCVYTFKDTGGSGSVCGGWNKEHMIPQSWFNYDKEKKCDAFHVYPTDATVNGARSNYPHGETNGDPLSITHGSHALGKLGICSVKGYTGEVYEPDDEYKGDIARTYFYFATCYENFQYSHENAIHVFSNNVYPGFQSWFLNLMLKWHRQDPVSKKEIDRNDAICSYQHNRNPFIDYPVLVEHIWGNKKNLPFNFSGTPVENVEDIKYKVLSSTNSITILDLQHNSEIFLRDVCGRVIFHDLITSSEYSINIHQGVYLLTVNDQTSKVVVK